MTIYFEMSSLRNIFYRLFGCCLPYKYDEYEQFDNREGIRNKKKLLTRG